MNNDTPDLATLRAMYPVASGGLTADEMARASNEAFSTYQDIYDGWTDTTYEVYSRYDARATELYTPVKRAAFALLLTMIELNE